MHFRLELSDDVLLGFFQLMSNSSIHYKVIKELATFPHTTKKERQAKLLLLAIAVRRYDESSKPRF
jgi:hypothetical protein